MNWITIVVTAVGGAGFYQLIIFLLKFQTEKKHKKAETNHLIAQSSRLIFEDWKEWSGKLEKRVDDLEKNEERMNGIIQDQRKEISELEGQVKSMKAYKKEMLDIINQQKSLIADLEKQLAYLKQYNEELNTELELLRKRHE